MVCFKAVRTVTALAIQNRLKMHQLNVANDFLNDELDDETFMKQPEGFVAKGKQLLVCSRVE